MTNHPELVEAGEAIYESRLREQLERTHHGQFVAIEPQSGDYFLGTTTVAARLAALTVHPDRLTHMIRIGHRAAVYLFSVQLA